AVGDRPVDFGDAHRVAPPCWALSAVEILSVFFGFLSTSWRSDASVQVVRSVLSYVQATVWDLEGVKQMKRLLAVLGVFALLGTLFVLASSSPSSAEPTNSVPIGNVYTNNGSGNPISVTATGCGYTGETALTATPAEIPGATDGTANGSILLDPGCEEFTVTAVDSLGQCTVESQPVSSGVSTDGLWVQSNSQVVPGNFRGQVNFRTTNDCAKNNDITIDKDITDGSTISIDSAAGSLTTFNYSITAWKDSIAGGADTDSPCAGSNTTASTVGATGPGGFPTGRITVEVLNGYIVNNAVQTCWYGVFEEVPTGWTLARIDATNGDGSCGTNNGPDSNVDAGVALVGPQTVIGGAAQSDNCDVDFDNELDPVPLTVTKTFTGRDYYTTIDRADFHVFSPGLCSGIPFDPFGGLLGSVGVFRTINASQLPQVVLATPDTIVAGWSFADGDVAVPCTYRVQENNAPEGCTALNPDGSNADGPYWEQTWAPGTTEFVFNIVNDCAETPEPTPEPTVAPTSTPKKPGTPGAKKPSGGGTAAPKFTG
ncbi:MAG: hypothetical protein ACR2PK_16670, partial [Acidimicrobiales bacterium]